MPVRASLFDAPVHGRIVDAPAHIFFFLEYFGMQVRSEFRKILMFMGFEEMPTNRWVESSFWNFDSLFQPQVNGANICGSGGNVRGPYRWRVCASGSGFAW